LYEAVLDREGVKSASDFPPSRIASNS